MIKFGITEQGDAAFNFAWTNALRNKKVDAAIIISKGSGEHFAQQLREYRKQIIYHCTITGLGGTVFEPHVPSFQDTMEFLDHKIIDMGFPKEHIVVRIDPLMPMNFICQFDEKYNINYLGRIRGILEFCEYIGITRVRYSYLDIYPHVKKRIDEISPDFCNTDDFTIDKSTADIYQQMFRNFPKISFESCCEGLPHVCGGVSTPDEHKVGCISKKDYEILGLDMNECTGLSGQRKACLCCAAKTELLNQKSRCGFRCAYCYWKD